MQKIRRAADRGLTEIDWLKSYHSFSFGGYRDRNFMGFGPLRVINDDYIAADAGFGMHGHADMEIITYVLSGAIAHKDSLGNGGEIRPGDVQVMSAGKGILHSEFNPSKDEACHLLQIWIMPDQEGGRPSYQQTSFNTQEFNDQWRLIVAPDMEGGALKILQDARVYVSRATVGTTLSFPILEPRKYWLHVASGSITYQGEKLDGGDALAIENESGKVDIDMAADSELLLFDLPA